MTPTTQTRACPFDGTKYGPYCTLLSDHNENNALSVCQYQFECSQIKEHLQLQSLEELV